MKIVITLSEVKNLCNDWGFLCREKGWNEWAVNEGGGHIEVILTKDQAVKYGLIKG